MSIMFIGIGLVEALPIIGVVIAFMTLFNKKFHGEVTWIFAVRLLWQVVINYESVKCRECIN